MSIVSFHECQRVKPFRRVDFAEGLSMLWLLLKVVAGMGDLDDFDRISFLILWSAKALFKIIFQFRIWICFRRMESERGSLNCNCGLLRRESVQMNIRFERVHEKESILSVDMPGSANSCTILHTQRIITKRRAKISRGIYCSDYVI
jgi:hypothetical protein